MCVCDLGGKTLRLKPHATTLRSSIDAEEGEVHQEGEVQAAKKRPVCEEEKNFYTFAFR